MRLIASKHDLTLFVIKHEAQIINKIAIFDIAASFMMCLILYSVNHEQVEYKRLHLCNFTHDSPKIVNLVFSWELFCLHSTKQHGKTYFLHRYCFSIVLKYFYV